MMSTEKTQKTKVEKTYILAAELSKQLRKEFGEEWTEDAADPDKPLATSDGYILMPPPWEQLTACKGVPLRHLTTIQGKHNSGKTTLAMHAMVQAQKQGYYVFLVDTEYKFQMPRFALLGGDVSNVTRMVCETVEEAFDRIDKTMTYLKSKDPNAKMLFVWDSLGMTPTAEESNADAFKANVASAARVIKRNIRRLLGPIYKNEVALIIVNHVRDNLNVMFGHSTQGYGGEGPYFASVLVLELNRAGKVTKTVKGEKIVTGIYAIVDVKKNHMSDAQSRKQKIKIGATGIIVGKDETHLVDADEELVLDDEKENTRLSKSIEADDL